MPIRPIVKYGDPVLHAPAAPVERIDDAIRSLLDDMVETMYAAPGIGLAAPQVGVPLRVIVIDLSVGEDPCAGDPAREPRVRRARGRAEARGGLPLRPRLRRLSHPARRGWSCAASIRTARERVYTATELLARAFCHEIDHIDGLLFVDRLSPLKRDLMKRKLRKRARDGWEEE